MAETKISATIITFNEERNIGRCLDSVRDIADEIIVVDSFSTDRTKEIALSKGAKFFECRWEGYGRAKNHAAAQASYDYILSIDADEELSGRLKNSIAVEKAKGLEGVFEFNRLTNYCGKWIWHCGWYPDKKIRLYCKNDMEWSSDIIHEEMVFKKKREQKFLDGDLHHYSYYTIDEHWAKARKYAEMGARRDLHKKNNLLFFRSVLGAAVKFIKMYFFQLGFLDGKEGFTICRISAVAAFLKYSHKRQLLRKNDL